MDWIELAEKGIWFGFAAIGFAILFNVPLRTLIVIFLIGALGGMTKVIMLHLGVGVIVASLCGSTLVGIVSIFAAHNKHAPPMVFAIPSVIPMVPGAFAYKMMLGLITLAGDKVGNDYTQILSQTINNGLKTTFILLSLALGVAIPMLITRKESAKEMRLKIDKKVNGD